MQDLVFKISKRTEKGRKVRMQGDIPCVIYGGSLEDSMSCQMGRKEMWKLLSNSKNPVISLDVEGKPVKCVLKDVQRDPFGEIIHLDFQCVRKEDTIKLKVPVTFVGQNSLDIRNLLLDVVIPEIQLQGHPTDMPENIEVDVSKLDYGDHILGKDLSISDKLRADIEDNDIVARVSTLLSNETDVESDELAEESDLKPENTI